MADPPERSDALKRTERKEGVRRGDKGKGKKGKREEKKAVPLIYD